MLIAVIVVLVLVLFIVRVSRPAPGRRFYKALADAGLSPRLRHVGRRGGASAFITPEAFQFGFLTDGSGLKTYRFFELISVDVLRNGATLHDTSQMAGGALIGGLLFGPVGMVLGALSRKAKSQQNVQRLSLKIYVRDFQKPYHEVVFFSSRKGVKADNRAAHDAAQQLEAWYGRFQTILASAGEAPAPLSDNFPSMAFIAEQARDVTPVIVAAALSPEPHQTFTADIAAKPIAQISKSGAIVRSTALCILGTFLLLISLLMAIAAFWFTSATLLACAALSFPLTARYLKDHGLIHVPAPAKAIIIAVAVIGSTALDSARVQRQSYQEYTAWMTKEFQAGRPTILTNVRKRAAQGDFGGIVTIGERYAVAADPDLAALVYDARTNLELQEKATRKSDLLTKIFKADPSDPSAISDFYDDLLQLEPDNIDYRSKRDQYEALARQRQPEPEQVAILKAQPVKKVAPTKSFAYLVVGSDDYADYKAAFARAAEALIGSGDCSDADFLEQGGWTRSINAGGKPVYFTYCGGMTIAHRIYVDARTGSTYR